MLAVLAPIVLLLSPGEARACSCAEVETAEMVASAELVFLGEEVSRARIGLRRLSRFPSSRPTREVSRLRWSCGRAAAMPTAASDRRAVSSGLLPTAMATGRLSTSAEVFIARRRSIRSSIRSEYHRSLPSNPPRTKRPRGHWLGWWPLLAWLPWPLSSLGAGAMIGTMAGPAGPESPIGFKGRMALQNGDSRRRIFSVRCAPRTWRKPHEDQKAG